MSMLARLPGRSPEPCQACQARPRGSGDLLGNWTSSPAVTELRLPKRTRLSPNWNATWHSPSLNAKRTLTLGPPHRPPGRVPQRREHICAPTLCTDDRAALSVITPKSDTRMPASGGQGTQLRGPCRAIVLSNETGRPDADGAGGGCPGPRRRSAGRGGHGRGCDIASRAS